VSNMNVYKGIQLKNYNTSGDVLHLTYTTDETAEDVRINIKISNTANVLYYGATVFLSNITPGIAKQNSLNNLTNWNWTKKEIYKDKLFHGSDFHIVDELQGISDESCKGQLKIANQRLVEKEAGLSGMFMFDGGIQMATLAMAKWTGNTSSLPLGYQSLKLYTAGQIDTELRCELTLKKRGSMDSEWDVVFIDSKNAVQAQINGLRMYMYQAN
jgi:hypothetical protein